MERNQRTRQQDADMPINGKRDTKDIYRKVEQIVGDRAKAKGQQRDIREPASPMRSTSRLDRDRTPTKLGTSASKKLKDDQKAYNTARSQVYTSQQEQLDSVRSQNQNRSKSPSAYTTKAKDRPKSPIKPLVQDKENSSVSMSRLKRSVIDSDHKNRQSVRDEEVMDDEDERLLDSLAVRNQSQYDPGRLANEFMNIVNNSRKGTKDFMPKGKCQQRKDGKNFMKVGEVDIYYDESVLSEILNFGMRSKASAGQN